MEKIRIYDDERALASMLEGCDAVAHGLKIVCTESTGSTNADAKEAARDAETDAVFISGSQSAGRGRLGRTFVSDAGGLYMSLLFKKKMSPTDAMKITATAAVCVARAIDGLSGIDTEIKWVNDIYVGGRKLAGILCEGACDKFGDLAYTVLGIGINLRTPSDASLSDIATSLSEHAQAVPGRLELAAAVIRELYSASERSFFDILGEYRRRSCVIGRRVRVIKFDGEYLAYAAGIDDAGALTVVRDDGTEEHISTGDVSIRLSCG